MLVKLNNPMIFARAIEIISELIIEVKIKLTDAGLIITAIDPANVAMVNLIIPKSSFSIYEPDNEVLGVNLDDLKKILKRCGVKSGLIFEKVKNTLAIKIEDRIKRNFTLSLIDVEAEEKEMHSIEYSSKVELDSLDFVDSIEDCAVVSDACSFIVENDKFIIEAKELNSARSEFSSDEAKIEAENCKSRYSLEYLQKFIKGSKLFPKTILNFAAEHPLRIDLISEALLISFLLAPRMEIED